MRRLRRPDVMVRRNLVGAQYTVGGESVSGAGTAYGSVADTSVAAAEQKDGEKESRPGTLLLLAMNFIQQCVGRPAATARRRIRCGMMRRFTGPGGRRIR